MKAGLFFLALLVVSVSADMYLHYPPGSNDRNRERNDNRQNGNLLFDSQNNAKGGYPWRGDATKRATDDALTYYVGSVLTMEWTNQHACGPNPNTYCQLVIQYATDDEQNSDTTVMPGMRDGYPDSTDIVESDDQNAGYKRLQFSATTCPNNCQQQNQQGTTQISDNAFPDDPSNRRSFYYVGTTGGIQYAMHEGIDYYDECRKTERNKGLYTSDQDLSNNDARSTRQNPNGGRRGLECPEERDYYPYWRYNPWIDLAVLTTDPALCEYYQENSQNIKTSDFCDCGQGPRDGDPKITRCNLNSNGGVIPLNIQDCVQVGGTWRTDPRTIKNLTRPDCQHHAFGRDNHLGNALAVDVNGQVQIDASGEPVPASYTFQIPSAMAGKKVVIRMRYNISTYDYPPDAHAIPGATFFDAARNCPDGVKNTNSDDPDNGALDPNSNFTQCINDPKLNLDNRPLYNRPYVTVFPDLPAQMKLSIALNTHQSGRTFQDRSFVFRVAERPDSVSGGAKIFNLNARGRRGNIVQCYPSVEYDFMPPRLAVTQGDWLHIQFHGSDFNEAKNANNGEGWQYSDRFNMLQTDSHGVNFPSPMAKMTMFTTTEAAKFWALLAQDPNTCTPYKSGDNNEQNSITNCGKLNRSPNRFPPTPEQGLVKATMSSGTYSYVSTRNNNFSNRSQKGTLVVKPGGGVQAATVVAAVFGSIAGIAVLAFGLVFCARKKPNSKLGQMCGGCGPRAATKNLSSTADMDYTRNNRK